MFAREIISIKKFNSIIHFYNFVEASTLTMNGVFSDTLSEVDSTVSTETDFLNEVRSIK